MNAPEAPDRASTHQSHTLSREQLGEAVWLWLKHKGLINKTDSIDLALLAGGSTFSATVKVTR